MDNVITLTTRIPLLLIFLLVFSGCQVLDEPVPSDADLISIDAPALTPMSTWTPVSEKSEQDEPPAHGYDPWPLWISGTQLRGANIYQRRVYAELDGPEFMGSGPLGPPYTQEDFDRLSALGANVVNISHPGLFVETPPYTLDLAVQSNLDRLLEQIRQADMFAVIAFRTGPGRSEFTFLSDSVGDWFDASYLNDQIWVDQEAQEAWVAMWKYTAERYRDHPVVIGYDLMVEPNANEVWLEEWDPQVFYQNYSNTLYDWNQLHPRITAAIRQVDKQTPILIGGMGYSNPEWLPYLKPNHDPRTIYTVHFYIPHLYTHQPSEESGYTYPGFFDTDWDGNEEMFNRDWLEAVLTSLDDFHTEQNVPLAINEFGVVRWAPGADQYLSDLIDLIEARGLNHAIWVWETRWEPFAEIVTDFNFTLGSEPDNLIEQQDNLLLNVIQEFWQRNSLRPSTLLQSR